MQRASRLASFANRYVIIAWALCSGSMFVWLAAVALRLRCRRARWTESDMDGVRVLVAADVGPAVIGVLRPRIVIPEWSLSLDTLARSLMLRHESEHILAYDAWLRFVGTCSLILFPWNVSLWIAVRRLRSAIELDCDRRVLRDAPLPRAYGMLLIAVSERRRGLLQLAPALVERRTQLERRLRIMTAASPRWRFLSSIPLMGLTALVVTGASLTPRPRSVRDSKLVRGAATTFGRLPAGRGTSRVPTSQRGAPTLRPSNAQSHPRASRPQSIVRAPSPVAAPESLGRPVTGTVIAGDTRLPVSNAEVSTIGLLLLGAPNSTCTNERGEFRLRVPLGDTRLEVLHPDYEFKPRDVAAGDSTADFIGARIAHDTTISTKPQSVWVYQGPTNPQPIFIVDGQVLTPAQIRGLPRGNRCGGRSVIPEIRE